MSDMRIPSYVFRRRVDFLSFVYWKRSTSPSDGMFKLRISSIEVYIRLKASSARAMARICEIIM